MSFGSQSVTAYWHRWRLDAMNANQWLLGVGVPSLFVIVFF